MKRLENISASIKKARENENIRKTPIDDLIFILQRWDEEQKSYDVPNRLGCNFKL